MRMPHKDGSNPYPRRKPSKPRPGDVPLGMTHLPCVLRPRLQCHRTWEVWGDLLRGQTGVLVTCTTVILFPFPPTPAPRNTYHIGITSPPSD